MNEIIFLNNGVGEIGLSGSSLNFYNNGIESGLVFYLDAANTVSYPGTGTFWIDTITKMPATLSGPTIGGQPCCEYFTFDGSNDCVLISGSTNLSLNTMSINVWTKVADYAKVAGHYFFEKTTNGSVNTQYSLSNFFSPSGLLIFRTKGLSTEDLTWSGMTTHNNTWIQITATFDGTYKRLYIDGVLKVTSAALTGTITSNSTGNAIIGDYGGGAWTPAADTYWLNGLLANISIYNRALSDAEVLSQYNTYKIKYV